MQTEIIKLKKGKHTKTVFSTGGAYWYTSPGAIRMTQADMHESLKAGKDLHFIDGFPEKELLGILANIEKGNCCNEPVDFKRAGDSKLINRIIRAGGAIAYINKLEKDME